MNLSELIDAVDQGEYSDSMFCAEFHRRGLCTDCEGAFSGDLEAAKRLHHALLPGWDYLLNSRGNYAHVWEKADVGDEDAKAQSMGGIERAWLLAILRAVEQDRGAKE